MVTSNAPAERQLAVLIDFENTGLKSIQWLFDQISDIGRIIVKRAYADWSVASDKRDQLLELGIEPIHLFRSSGGGKNSSDIRLAIDAVELMHQSPVDTFVIASSDSDFAPLVSKLRASGKTVIGAGYEATAARNLVISCDKYYYLEQEEKTASVAATTSRKSQESLTEALLIRGIRSATDEQLRVSGSKLNETLQRLEPSFSYRALGYPTFTKFIKAYPWLKVKPPKGPGDITIEVVDSSVISDVESTPSETWDKDVDSAWSARATESGQSIPGPTAATDAAKILGVSKLSTSRYKTLQRLLDSSDLLNMKWSRDGNTIIRR